MNERVKEGRGQNSPGLRWSRKASQARWAWKDWDKGGGREVRQGKWCQQKEKRGRV